MAARDGGAAGHVRISLLQLEIKEKEEVVWAAEWGEGVVHDEVQAVVANPG